MKYGFFHTSILDDLCRSQSIMLPFKLKEFASG